MIIQSKGQEMQNLRKPSGVAESATTRGVNGARRKRVFIGLGLAVSLLLSLTGCTNYYESDEYKALKADCAQVVKNLRPIADWPAAFAKLEHADGMFVATNLGHKSRAEFMESVRNGFPYLEAIAITDPNDTSRTTISIWATKMVVATDGTQFSVTYDQDQINGFIDDKTPVTEEIEQPLFGWALRSDDENRGTCFSVDKYEGHGKGADEDGTLNTNEALSAWGSNARDLVEMIQAANECQALGTYYDIPCATVDYDGSGADYDWGPTPLRNPFTDPFNDASLQAMSEIFWCGNQGLVVNETRTGCE